MLKILKGVLGVGVLAGGVYILERGDSSKNKKQETKYEYDQQGNLSSTRSNDVRVESVESSPNPPTVVAKPVVVEPLIKDVPAVAKPQEPQTITTPNPPTLSQKTARTKLICQLFPMNRSKVYGIARINQNTITSIDCKNSADGNLSVSLYEYGGTVECYPQTSPKERQRWEGDWLLSAKSQPPSSRTSRNK